MPIIGDVAGLLTSLFFAFNAIVTTKAVTQIGSIVLNRARVAFALLYLLILNLILFHEPLPLGAGSVRWSWLALSGLIGLAIGDAFLFQAYLSIGPRLGSLLFSLSTVFGVLEAWAFFGESLRLAQIVGIALCLGGILWVVAERQFQPPPSTGLESSLPADPNLSPSSQHRPALAGILFAILAAVAQATGLVFSRQGLTGDFSPIRANAIRMLAAVVALWLVALVQRQGAPTIHAFREHPSAVKLVALAALLGPVIGVSLSLLAIQNIPVGVASVLTSLAPILILPLSAIFFKEHPGWQPIAGTLLAMAGVVILFLT
jgi:drug/metabolite transporter (DMT)-like permease